MAFIGAAVTWLFTAQGFIASAARFVAASFILSALNRQETEGPRLQDLKVTQSAYGANIPIVYGNVRLAGNVIDASDFIETKHVKRKKKLFVTVAKNTTYTYAVHLAIMLCEGPLPDTVTVGRIWANGEIFLDNTDGNAFKNPPTPFAGGLLFPRDGNTHFFADNARFYRGTHDQPPDSTLEAINGVGNTPAYNGIAYIVLEDFQLQEYGNGIPNLEIELIDSATNNVETIVEDIASRGGVSVYANPLRSDTCQGYIITQAGNVWGAIEPLAGAYSFDLVVFGGVIRAVKRAAKIQAHIPDSDLAGRGIRDSSGDTKTLTRADVLRLPSEITLSYFDPSRDYQINTQRAFRDQGDSNNKISVEMPMVLTANEARKIADRMLWEAWAVTRQVKFTTSRRWERALEASQIVTLDVGNERRPFRIERMVRGKNGVVEFEAVFEDPTLYESDVQGSIGNPTNAFTNTIRLPGIANLHPFDAAIVSDEDDDAGLYYGVSAENSGWLGAVVERSEDGGSTYDELTDVFVAATVGNVLGTLGSARTDLFDETNEIAVTIIGTENELETVTELEIFNGENLAWVGSSDGSFGEWIQFRTVTAVGSPQVFRLTGLVRGLYGTEYAVDQHSAGEVFILFEATIDRSEDNVSEWNISNKYRAVSSFTEASLAPVVDITNTGEGKRPLSPVQLRSERNSANDDILITWVRRTRLQVPTLGSGEAPLGEETEEYEVDIFDGTGGGASVIRTETVTSSQFNYTEAMQAADGHSLGAVVKVRVYQISAVRGRGRHVEGIV